MCCRTNENVSRVNKGVNVEEEFCFSDFYQISYKTSEDWAWFIETLDKLNYKEHIKIEQKILPAPIDILINEFAPDEHIEYRDVLGHEKSIHEKISIMQKYLQWICPNNNSLIIIDPYFFHNLENQTSIIKKIFNKVKVKEMRIITDSKNFNQKDFHLFEEIFNDKKIKITYEFANNLHDRFYLSDSGRGFSCGTSLNSIMCRESIVQRISKKDYKELYDKYSNIKDN